MDNKLSRGGTPNPGARTPPSKTALGGVAFDKPLKPSTDSTLAGAAIPTPQEVGEELSAAGIKAEPDNGPSWLTEQKSSLTEKPEPRVQPKPAPTPPKPLPKNGEIPRVGKNPIDGIVPLRTYRDDIARAIERNRLSKTDVSVAEQERKLKRLDEERAELELKKKLEEDTARLSALEQKSSRVSNVPREPHEGTPQTTKPEPPSEPTPVKQTEPLTPQTSHVKLPTPPIQTPPSPPPPLPQKAPREELEAAIKETERELSYRTARREESSPTLIQTPKRTFRGILLGMGLLVGGALLLGGTYYLLRGTAPSFAPLDIESLIFAEATQEIPIETVSGRDLMGLLAVRAKETPVPGNTLTYFKSTLPLTGKNRRDATTQEWFERLESGADPALIRALHPTFMLAIHGSDGNQPLLVFKTSFYENAFAGMLEWEKTMSRDLSPLFGPAILGDTEENSESPSGSFFKDLIVSNKDTRVLTDLSGEIRLMYSFVDRQTIVITTNRSTFLEILARLHSTRVER